MIQFDKYFSTHQPAKNFGMIQVQFQHVKGAFASGPFPCWKAFSGIFRESIEKSMGRKPIGRGVFFFQVPRALFDGLFIDILCKYTLPETSSSHLKMDGWNANFLFGARPIFSFLFFEKCFQTLKAFLRYLPQFGESEPDLEHYQQKHHFLRILRTPKHPCYTDSNPSRWRVQGFLGFEKKTYNYYQMFERPWYVW